MKFINKLFLSITILILGLTGCSLNTFTPNTGNTSSPKVEDSHTVIVPTTSTYPVPYATVGNYLGIWNGKEYKPVFIKGINLGVGLPGTNAGDLAATYDQYYRWFERMHQIGFNAIRIYTLHFPRFYQAFARFNMNHQDSPLYLLHGIWLDEQGDDTDLYTMGTAFDDGIKEVVDCVYGNRSINQRAGRAYGTYDTNISQWVIGWIAGREIIPSEILKTNQLHPDKTAYTGPNLKIKGNPSEVWFTERIDKLLTHERNNYKYERPVSISSWPTLDPISHYIEPHGPNSQEDVASVDMANIELINARAGYFASYHAYPYYPNFINDEPEYKKFSDEEGPNNYLGYLTALKKHYAKFPLIIAEFGAPTSWGNAHYSYSGMNHGGYDEVMQGQSSARMMKNIYSTGCGGGALFEWIDEWWKRTWITDDLQLPRSRFALSHNIMAPEQNFGLIAFDQGKPDFNKWSKVTGTYNIKEINTAYDAEFFHLKLTFKDSLTKGDNIMIGFDTYGNELGESIMKNSVKTSNRNEFCLEINANDKAQLYVTQAYDLFGIWHKTTTDKQLFKSTKTDGEPWVPVRWKNDAQRQSDDGKYQFPDRIQEIGLLKMRNYSDEASNLDSVVINNNTVEIRIPWTLLQFADVSTRSVIAHDKKPNPTRETEVSDGISLSVSFKGELVETQRYKWDTWDKAPNTVEREKKSIPVIERLIKTIPNNP